MVAVDLIRLRKSIGDFWRASIATQLQGYLDGEDMEQVNSKS